MALDSLRVLLLELQINKDTVRCAVLGAEVPGRRQHPDFAILDFEKLMD